MTEQQADTRPAANGTAQPSNAALLDSMLDKATEYVPFMAKESITLTPRRVINFLCSPTKKGFACDEKQAVKFIMLCKARGLNPWEGDAFLVGYDTSDGPVFSLITAHQAFLKRAESNGQYDGMESGVIVKRGDAVIELHGDFFEEGDALLGGWARVHRKDRKFPSYQRLKLSTFNNGFGRWRSDPHGQICKCAEAAALRSAFPNTLAGMYGDEGGAGVETTHYEGETPIAKTKTEAVLEKVLAVTPAKNTEEKKPEPPAPAKEVAPVATEETAQEFDSEPEPETPAAEPPKFLEANAADAVRAAIKEKKMTIVGKQFLIAAFGPECGRCEQIPFGKMDDALSKINTLAGNKRFMEAVQTLELSKGTKMTDDDHAYFEAYVSNREEQIGPLGVAILTQLFRKP